MLTSCHIQNFRCLRDVKIDLAPVTAFVGPNASGKSAILAALNNSQSSDAGDRFRRSKELAPTVHALVGNRLIDTTKLPPGDHVGLLPPYKFQLIQLDLRLARSQNVLESAKRLHANGQNLTNVFATVSRKTRESLSTELCRLVPVFSDVDERPTANGQHQLVFQDRWTPALWYTPNEVSDGTILLLAFLILQHQPEPVDVIAIEEPERGLHPYLLTELVAMLRRLSKGEGGRKPIQFLLATHSAELLDRLEPEEVRFVTRDAKTGETRVEAPNPAAEGWKEAYREYQESLGSIWLSGGMGGVP